MARAARDPSRPRGRRVLRALLAGVVALALLYTWDGSRQPTSGAGWTLLFAQRSLGELHTVTLVPDERGLADTWELLHGPGDPPVVDFDRVVVVLFVDGGSVACRSRFDGLVVDPTRRLVAGAFSRGLVAGCDDATVADAFLVALDRHWLPPAPWILALRDPPPDVPGARLEVTPP